MSLVTLFTNALAAPTTLLPIAITTTTLATPTTITTTPASTTTAATAAPAVRVARNAIDISSGIVYTTHSPAAGSAAATTTSGGRPRKRHSKRHSNWYDYYRENTTMLEWVNPCGGNYEPSAEMTRAGRRVPPRRPKEYYNKLKISTSNELKKLKNGQQYIDISNIQMWSLHNKSYKFLPKLKGNSTIALERWYRNMQTYVGSFAYLLRIQLKWDLAKLQRASTHTARELNELLNSARYMLCELENTINGTQMPHRNGHKRLPQVTRPQMNKRLKLYTKRLVERNPNVLQEASSIDLRWVKYYYYDFLKTMGRVLRKYTKRRGQVAIPQQRKEFNEVEKNFGSSAAAGGSNNSGSSNNKSSRGKSKQRQMSVHLGRGSSSGSRSGSRSGQVGGVGSMRRRNRLRPLR